MRRKKKERSNYAHADGGAYNRYCASLPSGRRIIPRRCGRKRLIRATPRVPVQVMEKEETVGWWVIVLPRIDLFFEKKKITVYFTVFV